MNNIHKTGRTWQTPFGAPLLAILITLFSFGKANAQTVATYGFVSTSGTYAPITGGTVLSSATGGDDDTNYPTSVIGFPFTYAGVAYTNIVVSPNGYITLGTTGTFRGNINTINAFAADLLQRTIPTVGVARVQTTGIAPNQVCVIQFSDWGRYGSTAPNDIYNFQIRLTETTNTIVFVYGAMTTTAPDTKIVGLVGAATTDFNNRAIAAAGSWATSTVAATNGSNATTSAGPPAVSPALGLTYTWSPPAACTGTPTAVGTISSVGTSACSGVPFTLSLGGSPTSGLTYQWQSAILPAAFGPIAGATSSIYVATQTVATSYRCIVTCTASTLNANSTAIAVGMNAPTACYCTPVHNSFFGSSTCISNVTMGTINNTSAVCAAPYYTTFASTATTTTDLPQGVGVSLTVTSTGSSVVSVWIDYNQNGIFETTEFTQVALTGTTGTTTVAIPGTATSGLTKMRIRSNTTGSPNAATDACSTLLDGESEDYSVTIIASSACSAFPVGASNSVIASASAVCVGTPVNFSLGTFYSTTGITYQWQISTVAAPAFAPVLGATNPTYAIASQTVATSYRCVITCTNGGASITTPAVPVAQNAPTLCYCAPVGLGGGICITNVTLGNINNNSLCEPVPNYYTAFPNTITTNLPQGAIIPIGVTNNGDGIVSVWIDFNADGIFDPTPGPTNVEWIQPYITGANATAIANIVVPATAVLGVTKMRVRVRLSGNPNGVTDGCPNGGSGEAEDYFVNIVAPTTCTPVAISPVSGVATITTGANTINLSATGGATYVYGVVVGALPAGLTLNATTGVLSGTVTALVGATGSFTIAATSTPNTCSGTAVYTYTITAPGACSMFTNGGVPVVATLGVLYSSGAIIVASPAAANITYTIPAVPALPAGLTLNASTGVISGTPTGTIPTAATNYTVTATQTGCTPTFVRTISLSVVAPTCAATFTPVVTTAAPAGTVNTAYSFNASVTPNAFVTYTLAASSAALPAGLLLNATTGAIAGTPIAATVATGVSIVVSILQTNPSTCTAVLRAPITIIINAVVVPCPTFTASAATATNGVVGTAYSLNGGATASAGTLAYTVTPALPAGLVLNATTGVISGTPTAVVASVAYIVRASTSTSCFVEKIFIFAIGVAPQNPATAIDNALANLVKVSPNPSKGDFSVDFGTINMAKSSVRVYDAQGKVVFISENNPNLMTISLEKFANGIYLMEVETSKGRILKRLAKQ